MKPIDLLIDDMVPALETLSTIAPIAVSDQALVLELAIAGQESDWEDRLQHGGPARSFWQFEKSGAVAQLFGSSVSSWLKATCAALDIPYDQSTVFEAMAWNDALAATMARLLLWTDPAPLPAVGDVNASWAYYQRNWRPGAPRPSDWPSNYQIAQAVVVQSKQLNLSFKI